MEYDDIHQNKISKTTTMEEIISILMKKTIQEQILYYLALISNSHIEEQQLKLIKGFKEYLIEVLIDQEDIEQDQQEKWNLDVEIGKQLNELIGECEKVVQQELYKVVVIFAELGFDSKSHFLPNEYYYIFQKAEFLGTIQHKADQEIDKIQMCETDVSQDETIEKFLTYSFIYKCRVIDPDFYLFFGHFYEYHFTQLFKLLRQIEQLNCKLSEINDREQIEQQIKLGIRIMKAFSGIIQNKQNQKQFIDDTDFLDIVPLFIHINCDSSLNCTNLIKLPESQLISELQTSVFWAISCMINENDQVKQFMIKEQSLQEHLISITVSHYLYFKNIYQSENNNHSQQTAESTSLIPEFQQPSIQLLESITYLLYQLILNNNSFYDEYGQKPNFIESIIAFSQFNRKYQEDAKVKKITSNIRINSLRLLNQLHMQQNKDVIGLMIHDWRYIQLLIQIIGVAGGQFEENQHIIEQTNFHISHFFDSLFENQEQNEQLKELERDGEEIFEIEGGLEELDSNLYQNDQKNLYDFEDGILNARLSMWNMWVDPTNDDDW